MYNYLKAVAEDVLEYIGESCTDAEIVRRMGAREEWEDALNDELFCEDSVTGGCCGSYTCDAAQAREYVLADFETVIDALHEIYVGHDRIVGHIVQRDWEWIDISVRCSLLGRAVCLALDCISAVIGSGNMTGIAKTSVLHVKPTERAA